MDTTNETIEKLITDLDLNKDTELFASSEEFVGDLGLR
jgi:hypothetical protein